MTRRSLLAVPAALVGGRPLFSQSRFPGIAYRQYARCLPDYLSDLARRAYERRNAALAGLTTAADITRRQEWVRETFWRLAGGRPPSTPLNARTVGSFEREGYRVEKVLYESRPRFHIPGNLYIPTTGKPPYPGVLFQLGHSLNGKAAETYQRCCQGLARLGYLVLAFDPMGQGERVYYPDAALARTRLGSADDEHTVPGKQMLLHGDSSMRMQAWDAVRSLDYLASHPLVDARRLASTGQSGGGTTTMMLMAVDDRLATAVVCSGNTENVACANFNPPGSTDDAEQDFVDSGAVGFDRWDTLYGLAPKPLLISVSDKDFFGTYSYNYISSGWEEFQKLRKVYEVLGHPERLAWNDTPLPHGLSYDTRLQVYSWFARHLKGESEPVRREPPTQPEPDKILWVAESGNVVRTFGGETPFSLNRSRPATRNPVPLDALLRVDRPAAGLQAAVLGRVPSRGLDVEAIEVQSAPSVWLPAWRFIPEGASKAVVLAVAGYGRNNGWQEEGVYQRLARRGYTVCAADVRGIGDLSPEFPRGAPNHARSHQGEEDFAWSGMILGKPLLGQRVTDILALVAATGATILAASGRMTVPALFAAALDSRIRTLYLAGGLVSYRNVVETEMYSAEFANFQPGLLSHTDLPEVAAGLAPRRVILAGTVDAAGRSMDVAAVRQFYSGSHIEVQPKAQWEAQTLAP